VTRPKTNGEGVPVVACDIDGTLGEFHAYFLEFAEKWFGQGMPDPNKINPGSPLWTFMGVEQRDYRECKLAYRQSGLKRAMPVYQGSAALSAIVKSAGAEFWICTTRPYLRLDNIDPDTREWLRRNDIQYDAVLFGEDKYVELVRQVTLGRIVAVIDDLPEMLEAARHLGIKKRYQRAQPYNTMYTNAWLYQENYTLMDLIQEDIKQWFTTTG
jgi:hypothetical protein